MASGWYWHVHHDVLCEWCYDYEERVRFVKECKPTGEVETRLRLMQPVRGDLPERWVKAGAQYAKVYAESEKAWAEPALTEREIKRGQLAWIGREKAWEEYKKAQGECMTETEALHRVQCPGCPWDGKTIFPEVSHG